MDYIKINKDTWNRRAEIHLKSKFYDVEGFIQGKTSLNEIELNEVGSVAGKSLLHLQCHFGLDSLSWVQLGAKVTGVDFSSKAINSARKLAEQTGLDAQFICADLYEFSQINNSQFDIVFTSYGVICWLPDLDKWASLIANSLKSGGVFYIVEFHPFFDVTSGYSYFPNAIPDVEEENTYTENDDGDKLTIITWPHSLAEVINALINAGLIIEQFNEYPYSPYNCFGKMEELEKGKFSLNQSGVRFPLVYSIKACKPAP